MSGAGILADVLLACEIAEPGAFIRAVVGPGSDESIQDSYLAVAVVCIEHGIRRALVIGPDGDPGAHAKLRDGLRCAVDAGLPRGFMLAMVAGQAPLLNVVLEAERELARAGIRARVFSDEVAARSWLLGR